MYDRGSAKRLNLSTSSSSFRLCNNGYHYKLQARQGSRRRTNKKEKGFPGNKWRARGLFHGINGKTWFVNRKWKKRSAK
jgi:hypothetical protein